MRPSLAEVKLRPEIRKLCWQLLGPPPESEVAFMTNPDGSSRRPKQARPIQQETPPKDGRQPVRNEQPAKKTRKKKTEPDKPAVASHPATNNSAIMDHYRIAKEKNPDMMLIFRVGDFYELFGEDAEEASELLGLTLTSRDRAHTMAGFPHHQLETYLHKLLKEGKRVAICDQEDPPTREPIKREVKRVVASEAACA